ncbi:hypothetical protein CC80DRAFT_33327 [Byssothecium circinans]|uniref:Uncharacterized protein n=1 Tax=Byssothecium circinans TaxID=147558 RepID=A0A6A5U443_9PLEO|nr:hypothetical protein CC80DRAFT_33327 [Byssothecium circinans]
MMVPRSFTYSSHHSSPSSSPPRTSSEKMGMRKARASPVPRRFPTSQPPPSSTSSMEERQVSRAPEATPKATVPAAMPAATPPMHSKPVVIPPRAPSRTGTAPSTQTLRARGHNGGRPQRVPKTHKPEAIPPAVAALLAVTEIPKIPTRRRQGSSKDRRISMDELIQEWKQDETELAPSLVGSPLDLLLGRVDESEDEYGSLASLDQEKESVSMTSRSISSESLSTIPPSLDTDAPSFMSNWDNISTPESYRQRSLSERREKLVSSPPKEDCVLDHPLLYLNPEDHENITDLEIPDIVTTPAPSSERFNSFKSNLTASFQALKTAAKSFSNFTAPSVPPDDLLTRSLLSSKFTSEMRPKQMQGLPSPALRRYLNPQPTSISPTELSMQLHDSLMLDIDEETAAPMIQMQTYERRGRSKRRRKGTDPFSEAGRASSPSPPVRQREPRENGDFLRVIVLEMNMRRVGKLDAKAVGKARIWLPPRKLGASSKMPESEKGEVPDRWVATLAGEIDG